MKIETTLQLHKDTVKERRIIKRLLKIQENSSLQLKLEALRLSIENEIKPKLLAARHQDDYFSRALKPKKTSFTEFVSKPKLEGYEYTPEWWRAAEQKERQEEIQVRQRAKESELLRQAEIANFVLSNSPAIASPS